MGGVMRGLAFVRYAAAAVVRNRGRSISAILGVVLAAAFIVGSNAAIDGTVKAILDGKLRTLEADFFAQSSGFEGYNSTRAPAQETWWSAWQTYQGW